MESPIHPYTIYRSKCAPSMGQNISLTIIKVRERGTREIKIGKEEPGTQTIKDDGGEEAKVQSQGAA